MASAGHVRRPPSGAAWHEHRSRLLNASWRSIMTSSSLTTDIPDTLTLKHYAGRPVLSSSMYIYYMLYLCSNHATCFFCLVEPHSPVSSTEPLSTPTMFHMCARDMISSWMLFKTFGLIINKWLPLNSGQSFIFFCATRVVEREHF